LICKATLALLATFTCSAAYATPIGFQDYALGQSLESLKAHLLPDGKYGPVKFICSDAPGNAKIPINPIDKEIGLVSCLPMENYATDRWSRQSIQASKELALTVKFLFYQNSLFKIEIYADAYHENDLSSILEQKFGKPTSKQTFPVRTKLGVSHEQRVTTWFISGDSVIFTAPDLNLERLSIIFVNTETMKTTNELADKRRQGDVKF
jgi:hypothetical protein